MTTAGWWWSGRSTSTWWSSVATLPRPGETVVNGTLTRSGGGKSANQACAAARFGATTRFIGAVGDDAMADEALASVAGEGIDVSRCLRLPGVPTAVALIMVDMAGENQIAVASGANGSARRPERDRGARRASSRRPAACCCWRSRYPTTSSWRPPAGRPAEGMTIVVDPGPARPLAPELRRAAPHRQAQPDRGDPAHR